MYTSGISNGLLLRESRVMAELLLKGLTPETLISTVTADNLLQKRSPQTSRKLTRHLAARFSLLENPALEIILDGDRTAASQMLLAVIVKQNRLVGDFLRYISLECVALFKREVATRDWDNFFAQCVAVQENLARWQPSTVQKIRSATFTLLAGCGILDSSRTKKLLPFFLRPEVKNYLESHNWSYPLSCFKGLSHE